MQPENLFFPHSAILIPTLFMQVAVKESLLIKSRGCHMKRLQKGGGGILNSAKKLHETSENELYEESMTRIGEIISKGTGAVEIKSGYGLSLEAELKMLRVIRKIKERSPGS